MVVLCFTGVNWLLVEWTEFF